MGHDLIKIVRRLHQAEKDKPVPMTVGKSFSNKSADEMNIGFRMFPVLPQVP